MTTRDKAATIIDVAKAAGVSISTVSRVINDYEHVRPEIRHRVQSVMENLDYVPKQARRFVEGKSNLVGVMISALGSEYIAEVIRGIDEALEAAGYDLMLYSTHRQAAKEDFYTRTIAKGLADGLILVVPYIRDVYLDALRQASYPHIIVDVDNTDGKSWSVGSTNRQGGYDATRYLLSLNHRRIAFLSDILGFTTSASRLEGYKAALEEFGVPFDPELVKEDNYIAPVTRKLVEELMNLPNPPTAIFTTGDTPALRVMETLRQLGLLVPQDISLVGFDDIPSAATVYPGLTTIHHPMYEMGRTAVNVLLAQIKEPTLPPQHIQLPTYLVRRESCLALPAQVHR